MEKLGKIVKMELKTYTTVVPKFVFEKIKFNHFHYIQNDFIFQRPRVSKDQTSMFKHLVNYFILKSLLIDRGIFSYFLCLSTMLNDYVKSDKYFFFIKVGAENVPLKLNSIE